MDCPKVLNLKTVLHVGCGYAPLPAWLSEYREVRLDIDPECKPDIVASITEPGEIGPYDAVLAEHVIEHLYPHQVPQALKKLHSLLAPGGFAAIFVPDLEDARPTEEVLFVSPAGPIAGLDLFYGFRTAIALGMTYMAHHTGFTQQSLQAEMTAAGFVGGTVARLSNYNLMAVGFK